MKKILLTLLCLLTVSIGLRAKDNTLILTVDNLKVTNNYNAPGVVSDVEGTGFGFKTRAYKNGGLQFNTKTNGTAQGTSMVMTENIYGYTIKEVTFNFNSIGTTAEFAVYSNSESYPQSVVPNEAQAITYFPGTPITTITESTVSADKSQTVTINDKFFGFYLVSGNNSIINSIVVTYETPMYSNVPGVNGIPNYEMYVGDVLDLEIDALDDDGKPIKTNLFEIKPAELKYTFTSDSDLIKINDNDEDKTITALKKGTGTIEFSTDATEEYPASNGVLTFTVFGKQPIVSFQHESIVGKVGVGVVYQHATTEPSSLMNDLTYELIDPETGVKSDLFDFDEAQWDAFQNSGEIPKECVTKAGTAIVIASTMANDEYASGQADYSIIILDADSDLPEENTTELDFTVGKAFGLNTKGSTDTSDLDDFKAKTYKDITFSFSNRYTHIYDSGNSGSAALKFYKTNQAGTPGGSITISVPKGFKITKIDLDGGVNTDLITSNTQGGAYNATTTSWDADESSSVQTVTLSNPGDNSKGKTITIWKIVVLWQSDLSDLKPADLSFKTRVYNLYEGERIKTNPVTNPHNIAGVVYDIDCATHDDDETMDDCTVEYVASDDELEVYGGHSGTFTVSATTPQTDEYRSGLAIMRVNVFPNYDKNSVYAGQGEKVIVNENAIISDSGDDGVTIFIDVPSQVSTLLYYVDPLPDTQMMRAASYTIPDANPDIQPNDEWETYDPTNGIELFDKGRLYYSMNYYTYFSPVKSLYYNVADGETAVEALDAERDGEERWFDVQGRELKGAAEKGLSIRVRGGKAEKIIR